MKEVILSLSVSSREGRKEALSNFDADRLRDEGGEEGEGESGGEVDKVTYCREK